MACVVLMMVHSVTKLELLTKGVMCGLYSHGLACLHLLFCDCSFIRLLALLVSTC